MIYEDQLLVLTNPSIKIDLKITYWIIWLIINKV